MERCARFYKSVVADYGQRSKHGTLTTARGAKEKLAEQHRIIQQKNEEIGQQTEELLAINHKLVEMDNFKQGMTGMIVHDLKNPLNIILNLGDKDPESQVLKAKQYGRQMLNLVLNILDVHKYEESVMKIDIQNASLYSIANDAEEEVVFLAREKDINIINEINTETSVAADADILHRVFVNLLTNAIKYTPAKGTVTMRSEPTEDGKQVKISLTDTGQGIPADKIYLVFQKFGQVTARDSGGVRSTGLGLTFCKMAVEAHDGAIGVESEVGKGTCFWFTVDVGSGLEKPVAKREKTEAAGPLILTEEAKLFLKPFHAAFARHWVYEFSEVEALLENIPPSDDKNIERWKADMRHILDTLSEEDYNNLLAMIE